MLQEAETFYPDAPADRGAFIDGLGLEQTISGAGAGAARNTVVHPASGEVLTSYPQASLADIRAAVAAAKAAFPAWSQTRWDERRRLIEALADALWANRRTMSYLIALESGRPLRKAYSETYFSVDYLRLIAAQELPDEHFERAGTRAWLTRRPIGVAAAIAPWNAPLILGVAKIANALLAGDTLVIRPAPQTPLSALYLGMLSRAIFPAGVYNTVTGDNAAAAELCGHPDVAKISFTGSTETGRIIAAAAAPTLKQLTLELGGNDAAIVLPDASIEAVAATAWAISLENAGQFCAAIKRLYVHRDIYDDVRDALVARLPTAIAGDAFDPASTLSPLQSEAQRARVAALGADCEARGCRMHRSPVAADLPGFFLPPTLVEGCTQDMPLVVEEQFGPILPIMPFDDEDTVIELANHSQYGLGGSIWSADVDRAVALAQRLEVGSAWVNQHGAYTAALPLPFAKQSGIGMDFGRFGVAEHTRPMLINVKD